MAQNADHGYCTTRFQDLDDQLHNVHEKVPMSTIETTLGMSEGDGS